MIAAPLRHPTQHIHQWTSQYSSNEALVSHTPHWIPDLSLQACKSMFGIRLSIWWTIGHECREFRRARILCPRLVLPFTSLLSYLYATSQWSAMNCGYIGLGAPEEWGGGLALVGETPQHHIYKVIGLLAFHRNLLLLSQRPVSHDGIRG